MVKVLPALRERLRRRGAHAYCLGLPKCGTHSLADVLAGACRAAHEPQPDELLDWMVRLRAGTLRLDALRPQFARRHRELRLDFESSHLLADFAPLLVEQFPRARFVLMVRQCQPWLDSMINDQINLRRWERYPQWRALYDHYFGTPETAFPPQERALQELELYPLANYLAYWKRTIGAITAAVPAPRLLTLRVDQLAASLPRLAAFLRLPPERLAAQRSHAFQAPVRHEVLAHIDPAHVQATIDAVCGAQERALFGPQLAPKP